MSYSEGANTVTEFGGTFALVITEITPDAATGNITIGEYDNAVPIGFVFTEDLDSNCLAGQAETNGSTSNQIDIKLWNPEGTAATSFKTFRLLLLCSNN